MIKPLLTFLLLISLAISAHGQFLIQPNDTIAIVGDSITEQTLYSAFIEDYLLMCQPTTGQKIVQFGWGGEGAPSFLRRMDTDFFPFHPTVATTCYGMNDGYYAPYNDNTGNQYRTAQTAIVETMKKNGVRVIVLGSAKCVDSHYFRNDPKQAVMYNDTLGKLAAIDKDIAARENVIYADIYGTMTDVMQKAKARFGDDYNFGGGDGVHPDLNGHLVMAYAFLKALGCDGNIGTITVDLAHQQATGTPGQQIVSVKDGTVDVKSTRYPFCFNGAPDDRNSNTTTAITTVFPFNQDLNRYQLIVHGLTSSKARVIWGGTTKEYAAADLAKGINLAADFPVNPFLQQFNKVDAAVHAQQADETMLIKNFMHNEAEWSTSFAPGSKAAFDQVIAAAQARHTQLAQAADDLVIPLEHTIQIAPVN